METNVIIKGHPWKPQDLCSHWLSWNVCLRFLLCLCKAGDWGVLFMPPFPSPIAITALITLLISPRQQLPETAKKFSLLCWLGGGEESLMFPKNNSTIQSPFQPRIFLHYKINGSSFDSVKRFSINIYWKEENQSFTRTKGELSVKGSLKWEKKINVSWDPICTKTLL